MKRHGRYATCAAALMAAALAAGCASAARTGGETQGTEYRAAVNSLILNGRVRVLERTARQVDGLLEARVRGQNTGGTDAQFEYRFVWLDKDGAKIETATPAWKSQTLHPKEEATIGGVAPSPEAADFLLSVRGQTEP